MMFPSLNKILRIFITLPVTSATAERSFSALKAIKSQLRTSMMEKRLSALACLLIHNDQSIDIEQVVENFSKKSRKLMF